MQWELIKARKENGMNQQNMADLLKISMDAYGKKERGTLQFTLDEMFIISDYFNKSLDDIFLRRNCNNNAVNK